MALAAPAAALNTRVSISNFEWSNKQVHIDLGEKVTWDWLGPDLAHSVTGVSTDALAWDSDPTTDAPSHQPGDTYTIQFTAPGTYQFQCKLHSFVRGEVVVSAVPGNPSSDPGPQPPLNIDVVKPTLGGVTLKRSSFHSTKGVGTRADVSERGTLDAEYYRVNSQRQAGLQRLRNLEGAHRHQPLLARRPRQALQGTPRALPRGAACHRPRGQRIEAGDEGLHDRGLSRAVPAALQQRPRRRNRLR